MLYLRIFDFHLQWHVKKINPHLLPLKSECVSMTAQTERWSHLLFCLVGARRLWRFDSPQNSSTFGEKRVPVVSN